MIQPSPGSEPGAVEQLRTQAWAEAFVSIGRALMLLGQRLRDIDAPPPGRAGAPAADTAVAVEPVAVPRGGLGPQQRAVLALGGLDTAIGLAAADVAQATGYARPNAHNVLKRLEALGYLEQVADERPMRWRKSRPT